jgi:hypothetical protein
MCYERLRKLRCGHYESYQTDFCHTRLGRACKEYTQLFLAHEKSRSCYKCKAEKMTTVGVASPSLRLAKSEMKTIEGQEVEAEDGRGGDETLEDKCWEKYLL